MHRLYHNTPQHPVSVQWRVLSLELHVRIFQACNMHQLYPDTYLNLWGQIEELL